MPSRVGGFSLFECVVAIALLGGSILAGLELMEAQATQELDTARVLKAETIVSRELELVRAATVETLVPHGFTANSRYPDFQVRRAVTVVDASTREVTIEVRWASSRGDTVTRSALTFRCEAAP